MNKKNFGRVIKRIERFPRKWDQKSPPSCGMPFCFMGHAQFIRTGSSKRGLRGGTQYDTDLLKWLGIAPHEFHRLWSCHVDIADFKRWHKAGKVS